MFLLLVLVHPALDNLLLTIKESSRISAEVMIENLVFVKEFIAAAPLLADWTFTALKEAVPDIEEIVVNMVDYKFSASDIHFYADGG